MAPRLWPELAREIGLNESILLLQIEFWIRTSTTEEREGRHWTYQSTRDIQAFFSFWSVATIQRAIQSLVEKKLIYVGNFNKYKYDKTRWFAINEDGIGRLTSVRMAGLFQNETPSNQNETRSNQNETRLNQNGTTIPESTTESTTENTTESTSTAATNIFLMYELNIGRPSPAITAELMKAVKDLPVDWIRDAIEEAVLANVRKWNYVKAILDRWKVEGRQERREFRQGPLSIEESRRIKSADPPKENGEIIAEGAANSAPNLELWEKYFPQTRGKLERRGNCERSSPCG